MTDLKSKIRTNFNEFNGKNLEILNSFYAPDVLFIDPVTQVRGLGELKKYYQHAYKNVLNIRFDFSEMIQEGNQVVGVWVMQLAAKGLNKGRSFPVHGSSLMKFNSAALVEYHRDYVDMGEMIYEKLPVQGFVIQQVKKLLRP